MDVFRQDMSREKVQRLIEMYEERKILYDNTHRDYHNGKKRSIALQEIGNELGIREEDVKKKINVLRTQYATEKQKEAAKPRDGSDNPYVSKWLYYPLFHFLDDFLASKRSNNTDLQGGHGETSYDRKRAAPEEDDEFRFERLRDRMKPRDHQQFYKEEDEDDIFAKYIAAELRSISDISKKRYAKMKIHHVLYEIQCSETEQSNDVTLSQTYDPAFIS